MQSKTYPFETQKLCYWNAKAIPFEMKKTSFSFVSISAILLHHLEIIIIFAPNKAVDAREMKLLLTLLTMACAANLHAQTPRDSLNVSSVKVGYTQEDQRTTTGNIVKVDEKQFYKGLVTSALDALTGQAAGVQVQTGSNQEAMVSAIRVRGTTSLTGGNDPLVIIDGVASDLATLSTVFPADIESFTILKDASETSQYGSRGASGVIQVSTKKGRGGRFHISYDGNIGFEKVYKHLDMLSADAFRQVARQQGIAIIDGGGNTDYGDAITRTGLIHNHHVAFGGGTESSNYRVSFGLTDHHTVVRTNRLRNYFAKLDMSQRAFDDRVTFDLGVFGSLKKNNRLPFQWKLLYSAATFNPTIPNGRNAAGGYDKVPEAPWISNPNELLSLSDDQEDGHVNAHLRAKIDLGYDILLTLFGSYSYNMIDNAHLFEHEAYRANAKSEEMLGNISIEKTFKFSHSHLHLFALGEHQSVKSKGFHVTATGLSTNEFGYNNIAVAIERPWEGAGSFVQDSKLASFLFSAKYTLMDRYTLSVNARTDGSSKVGRNNHWGFFPSVSASWVVWDQSIMKNNRNWRLLDFVNYLKLRVGYGKSGNLGGIDAYNSLQLVAPNGTVNVGGQTVTVLSILRNANPDLRWEVKRTFNAGLNIGMWNRRITLSLDFYRSKTSNMLYLYDVPVPPFTYDKMLANIGSMHNSGLEIGCGITPLRNRNMELNVGFNMSFERNRLLSLEGFYGDQYLSAPASKGIAGLYGAGFHGGSNVVNQIVGQPIGVFYLPHCTGLTIDEQGVRHYETDGVKHICGQAMPKMRLGSNISFRYRQWDIAIQANGAFGHKIYNGTALSYMNMLSLPNYNVMAGAPEMNIQDQTITDYWLERGDYLNIDYVTVGWNVPVRSKYIQNLRLSASVNNLCTFTGYSGLSPMVNSSVVNSTLGVDDKGTFPVYRTYAVGVSVQF